MNRSAVFTATGALMAVFAFSAAVPAHDSEGASGTRGWHSLVGAWTSEVTHLDCVSGSPVNPPTFKAHDLFALGGTYSQFGSLLGSRRSTGFGTWRRAGRNAFTASFTFFRFDDATGFTPTAIVKIEREITLTGPNDLSSTNKTTVTSLDGSIVLQKTCSTETGTRM